MPTHVSAVENCDAPAARKLLLAYGMHRATQPEMETFERHVRSCAKCSDDLAAMWRVAELIDDWMRRPGDAPAGVAALVRAGRRRRIAFVALALVAAAAAGYFLKTAL